MPIDSRYSMRYYAIRCLRAHFHKFIVSIKVICFTRESRNYEIRFLFTLHARCMYRYRHTVAINIRRVVNEHTGMYI